MARGIREEIPVRGRPVVDLAQRPGIEAVEPLAPILPHAHQAGIEEDAQVLGDGRLRDIERPGQAGDGLFSGAQLVQDGAAGRVGHGTEYIARLCGSHAGILISNSLYVKHA